VKDFVKQIKQEDARIEQRKRNLARVARAKPKVPSVTPTPPASEQQEKVLLTQPKPTLPDSSLSVAETPARPVLHPSLPPKPGSPAKPPQDPKKDATLPVQTPVPVVPSIPAVVTTAPPSDPAPPAPIVIDGEITKHEEVSAICFVFIDVLNVRFYPFTRTNNDWLGCACAWPVTNICNILGRLVQATLCY
jgi:hypothetical protein